MTKQRRRHRMLHAGGGKSVGDYFWFTVVDRICEDEVGYTEAAAGLLVTVHPDMYTADSREPRDKRDDDLWLVQDVLGWMDGYDMADVIGSVGKASYGYPIDEPDNGLWILDAIKVYPDCTT